MVLIEFIGLLYTYPMRNHQYIRKILNAFTLWLYIGWMLVGRFHASDKEKITISCRLSGNVWPSSGGIAACRLLNSGCLAMYRCITS